MAKITEKNLTDRSQQILDVTLKLIQAEGYNSVSYRNIAEKIGIRTASLHYHFPTKADLGLALVKHYADILSAHMQKADKQATARQKIETFTEIFHLTLTQDLFCLCGMIAAERNSLPEALTKSVADIFEKTTAWLSDILQQGAEMGEFKALENIPVQSEIILAQLYGAMLIARNKNDIALFERTLSNFLDQQLR